MATRSKTVKGVSINGLTTRQQQAMKKHAKHHTAKHLKDMKTRMSKGQKQYMFMSDVKKAAEDYESQATEEAEKAGKRSLWSTVGGVVGAGLALMAAPAVIGTVAGAGLLGTAAAATGASTLATGIGTGLLAGGGSAIGGKKGKKLAESTGAKRKDIEIEIEVENIEDINWFTGKCEVCCKKIVDKSNSVRYPCEYGAWKGTFCSLECLSESSLCDNTEDENLRIEIMKDTLLSDGIMDRSSL